MLKRSPKSDKETQLFKFSEIQQTSNSNKLPTTSFFSSEINTSHLIKLKILMTIYFGYQIILFLQGIRNKHIHKMILALQGFFNFLIFSLTPIGIYFSNKGSNFQYNFGYKRIGTLVSFANCLLMIILNLFHILSKLNNFIDNKIEPTLNNDYIWFGLILNIAGCTAFKNFRTFIPITELKFQRRLINNDTEVIDIQTSQRSNIFAQKINILYKNKKAINIYQMVDLIKAFISQLFTEKFQALFLINEKEQYIAQITNQNYEDYHIVYLHFLINFCQACCSLIIKEFNLYQYSFINIAFALVILLMTIMHYYSILQVSFAILSQQIPFHDRRIIQKIQNDIQVIDDIKRLEKLHIWGLTSNHVICTLRVKLNEKSSSSSVKERILNKFRNSFNNLYIEVKY